MIFIQYLQNQNELKYTIKYYHIHPLHSPIFYDIILNRLKDAMRVHKRRSCLKISPIENMNMETLVYCIVTLIVIVLILFIVFQSVHLLKNLSRRNIIFTEVLEPEIKIILQGGIPVDCIANVKGYSMIYTKNLDKKEDWTLVKNSDLTKPEFAMYKIFEHQPLGGYFFYGILPNRSIATAKIDAARLVENPTDIGSSLIHKPKDIDSLRAKTERRVVFNNVEIGGGSTLKINLGFTVVIELVHPLVAMFERRGNFGEMVDEALGEIITREALKLTDDNLFASNGGVKTQIFDPQEILIELRTINNNIHNSGYCATAVIYHGFDFTADSKGFVEEKAKVREAMFKRQERLQEAEADKKTLELRGEGRASAIHDQIKAQTKLGVNPDLAATEFARMVVAEAVSADASSVRTFIERGAVSIPLIPTK